METSVRIVQMCATVEDQYLNCALLNPSDPLLRFRYAQILPINHHSMHGFVGSQEPLMICTLAPCPQVTPSSVALNFAMRKQWQIDPNQLVRMKAHLFDASSSHCVIGCITITVDFLSQIDRQMIWRTTPLCFDRLQTEFRQTFAAQAFCVPQTITFRFEGNKTLQLEVIHLEDAFSYRSIQSGLLVPASRIRFRKRSPQLALELTQPVRVKDYHFRASNFEDEESKRNFIDLCEQAQCEGNFDAGMIQSSGIGRIRGMLLYGPVGGGKTSFAIAIAQMLQATENKWIDCSVHNDLQARLSEALCVSQTTQRKRFKLVVLDRIDSLFEARQVVQDHFYRLLDALSDEPSGELLIVGTTSRLEHIPTKALRAARLEVQVEVTLPSEHARIEVLHPFDRRPEWLQLTVATGGEPSIRLWQFMIMCFLLLTLYEWLGESKSTGPLLISSTFATTAKQQKTKLPIDFRQILDSRKAITKVAHRYDPQQYAQFSAIKIRQNEWT